MKRKTMDKTYIFQTKCYYCYHCGPFAIYNFLINNDKYMNLAKLIKICKTDPNNGTPIKYMNDALNIVNKECDINIKLIDVKIYNINNILKHSSIILLYHWEIANDIGEHYVLIEGMVDGKYKLINDSFDKNIEYITRNELKEMLLYYEYNINGEKIVFPQAWSL